MLICRNLRNNSLFCGCFQFSSSIVGLPFKWTQKDASQKINSTVGFFDLKVPHEDTRANKFSSDTTRAQYLPFYGGSIDNIWSEYVGQYGVHVTQTYTAYERDSTTGKYRSVQRQRTRTDWYPATGTLKQMDYSYRSPDHLDLQLYADYSYPRKTVESALIGDFTQELKVLSSQELMFDEKEKQIVTHSMKQKIAKERLYKKIDDYQRKRSEDDIHKTFKIADTARVNKIIVKQDKEKIQLVKFHYPAYVCKYSKTPPMYRIVNGYSGKLTGNFMLDTMKIGVVSGLISSVIAMLISVTPNQLGIISIVGLASGMIGSSIYNSTITKQIASIELQAKENIQPGQEMHPKINSDPHQKPIDTKHNIQQKHTVQPKRQQKILSQEKRREVIKSVESSTIKSEKPAQRSQSQSPSQPLAKSSAVECKDDPANIILKDQECKLFNLRMGKKYTLRELNEAYEKSIKKWEAPQYTGSPAIASTMQKQLQSIYEYTLKKFGRKP